MSERNYAIDFIRFVAIIGVVLIHTSTTFTDHIKPDQISFYIIHGLNQFARFSVPLFFAISGFLLANRYANIKSPMTFYKKRFAKIIIPYIFWTLIYFFTIFPNPLQNLFSIKFLDNLFAGKASYQLYFIPTIIIFYLIFPFIIYAKKIILNKFSLTILLIIETIILTLAYFTHFSLPLYPPLKNAVYNLLPFIIGIYFGLNHFDLYKIVSKNLSLVVTVFLALWGIMIMLSMTLFRQTGSILFLRDQWRIEVMIYGIISGGLFYYIYEKYFKKFQNFVLYLSRFSFGIFFVHVAILHNTTRYILETTKIYNLFTFIAIYLFVIGASLLFSIIFSRVKILDRFLGLRG